MLQTDKLINNALNKALRKLAQSYDYIEGNWRHSSKQLDDVARILLDGEWSSQVKTEMRLSIQRRINRRYPTIAIFQDSGHCTQHIAENAIRRIDDRLRKMSSYPEGFVNLQDHV